MGSNRTALVVTSISGPDSRLRALASGCAESGYHFILIGDETSPPDFTLEGCEFFSLQDQRQTEFEFAQLCPTRHYARKNIGYLVAIAAGAEVLRETDDDNIPYEEFWRDPARRQRVPVLADHGWINVYQYFSDQLIWPRGMPLDAVRDIGPAFDSLPVEEVDCPIQQGLANENPDTDALYRLFLELPQSFRRDRRLALADGTWTPFNSQNTTWWRDAFPLLYLPVHCSFRMTDIWRSFVAQRIAWANDWPILFHGPNVWQERNEHDLMKDFRDEVPGYLNNRMICETLGELSLQKGFDSIAGNLEVCYDALISRGFLDSKEMPLLQAWIRDLGQLD